MNTPSNKIVYKVNADIKADEYISLLSRTSLRERRPIDDIQRIDGIANYWISRPPILVRGLPLILIPSRPLYNAISEFWIYVSKTR